MTKHAPRLYAGLTGAGLIKLGVTTCVRRREKTFQCVDPNYRTMYTVPESDVTEQELLRKIRSMGFRVGRSREVFDMSLSLVSDIMAGKPPRGGRPGRELLRAFLAAELAPGLSVEKACYPSVALFEGLYTPTPHEQSLGRRLLYQAGLVYLEHDSFEPGRVIIEHPLKFAERFPELKHVIPFVLHSKGVWVMSDAAPVEHTGPKLVS